MSFFIMLCVSIFKLLLVIGGYGVDIAFPISL